ncbi:MAG: hypothetical protein ACTHP8_21070 [Bosea sp. (in: a-proteobacteria)]|uniref:hypothetical protein n=1 Tax=Bosea sp. (in: a-proteobacteria) TaxID=1871050 RepID=UPI003F7C290A
MRNSAIFLGTHAGMTIEPSHSRSAARLLLVTALTGVQPAMAQSAVPDSFFSGRPAFSQPEQPGVPASCESIAAQLPDSVPPDSRVDMAIAGPVTLIQSDGTVWYVAVCADPGVRVLCVTYGAGDLKLGDIAVLRGGYSRQNTRHVMLDPCLASRE